MFDLPSTSLPFVSGTLAVDVQRLAEQRGIPVILHCFSDELDGALVPVLGQDTIVINREHSFVRRRFTLAHELAHYEKHREPGRQYRCSIGGRLYVTDPIEREANQLAGQLLMPTDLILAVTSQTEWTLQSLSHSFMVSSIACEKRLRELRIPLKTEIA